MGIDISKKEIQIAKNKFKNLKFEIQNAENMNFENNSVGAFFMINVIHYLNKAKAINEIYKKLRHGGYLFIHFNLSIIDYDSEIDYNDPEENILKLTKKFKIIHKKIFKRLDKTPIPHTHKILELILQKS